MDSGLRLVDDIVQCDCLRIYVSCAIVILCTAAEKRVKKSVSRKSEWKQSYGWRSMIRCCSDGSLMILCSVIVSEPTLCDSNIIYYNMLLQHKRSHK
jgi:hypothetical protein